jgi:hypothetical protein
LIPLIRQISEDLKPALEETRKLFGQLTFDSGALGVADLRAASLSALKSRLEVCSATTESLTKWITYHHRLKKVAAAGLDDLARQLDAGMIEAKDAPDKFRLAYYVELMRAAFQTYPELGEFNGVSHEQVLNRFRELDAERLTYSRKEVALAHYEGIPHGDDSVGK